MKKIANVNVTKQILEDNQFNFKKKFGQNFLIDANILASIINKAGINKEVNVIEIGPGIGSLTQYLVASANQVVAYEIDDTLIPILTKEFSECDNFTLIHKDVLKANIEEDIDHYFPNDYPIYLVANLPYYITTPIILHFLEKIKRVSRYVVMVQAEVCDRFTAKVGTKDYNSLSIFIQYRAKVYKALNVSKNVFMPKPQVDSSVVIFDLLPEPLYALKDEEAFFQFVRNCFANRRKTLVNNVRQAYGISKEAIEKVLVEQKLDVNVRSEALEIKEFVCLFEAIQQI